MWRSANALPAVPCCTSIPRRRSEPTRSLPKTAKRISRPRQRALDLSVKIATEFCRVKGCDFDELRAHGFDDEEIWALAGIAALFGLCNRTVNYLSMRPNDESI